MPMTQKLIAVAAASLLATSAFALTSAEVKAEKQQIQAAYKAAKT